MKVRSLSPSSPWHTFSSRIERFLRQDTNSFVCPFRAATDNPPVNNDANIFNDAVIASRLKSSSSYAQLQTRLDTEALSAYIAASTLLANWDGYWNNHFLSISPAGKLLGSAPNSNDGEWETMCTIPNPSQSIMTNRKG